MNVLTQKEVDAKELKKEAACKVAYDKFVKKATEMGIVEKDGSLDSDFKEIEFKK